MTYLNRFRSISRPLIFVIALACLLALPVFASTASAARGPHVADRAADVQAQSQSAFCPPTIGRGNAGHWVEVLQTELNEEPNDIVGPTLKVDGIFGEKTERAVERFQEYYGLAVDGVVGPNTWFLFGYC